MTHDRPARTEHAVAARHVLRIGSWKVSATVVAWGLSAVFHGGLLVAAHFVTWGPPIVSNPKISFARGDQATRIQVLLLPWPDSAKGEETQEEPLPTKSSTVAVNADEVVVKPLLEDTSPERSLEPPADAQELKDDNEDPPADKAVEPTPLTEPVEAFLGRLIRRFEGFFTPPETGEQVDHRQPLTAEAVTSPTEETVHANESSSQTAGVETGVKMLDLPSPKYPSLSRRRGEEGLVLLQVEVRPDGSVGEITVLQDPGFRRLTEAAISAAGKGRFKPATRDGHPIRATVRIPFRFALR